MKTLVSNLFSATLESYHESILWVDAEGRILVVNEAATRLLGFSKPEILEKMAWHIRTDISKADWSAWWEKVKTAASLTEPGTLLGAGDKIIVRSLHSNFLKLADGSEYVCWIFASWIPISGQKLAEENVGNIYQKIFELIGDSIFIKDRKHRLVMMNDANCRAIGRPREQLLGLSDYDLFPKSEADIFRARDEKVFVTGQEDVNEETFTALDLETKTVVTRKQLYVDPEGNAFIVGIFKDISALKNAEAKLQKANEGLEEKVRERTRELEQANQEMQVHIGQLHYLNEKGRNFARLLQREDVLKEIFITFSSRYPGFPVQLVEPTATGIKSTYHTKNMAKHLPPSLERLDLKRIQLEKNILFTQAPVDLEPLFPNHPDCLWIPFFTNTGLLGGMQIFVPKDYEIRVASDLSLLGALSNQAAAALENANHYLALREKTRIESELQVAKKIQMHYVPATPSIPNFALYGMYRPAREIGGDYLDYFQNENGDWIIVIADVCGKGVPAALVMTSLRSYMRSEGRRTASSKELLVAVNHLMGNELERENSFITCLCIVISKTGDTLNFSRAGHPQVVEFGSAQVYPKAIASKGMALGMASDGAFNALLEEVTLELHPGDRFFAYTDGVDEAMNSEHKAYGREKLFKILDSNRYNSPKKLVEAVLSDVHKHVKGHIQFDDMTLVALEKIR